MQITIEAAVQFDQEYERAQTLVADALMRRNRAVLELLEAGVSQVELARALGKSPGRVSQIATAARQRREREYEEAAAINSTRIPDLEAA